MHDLNEERRILAKKEGELEEKLEAVLLREIALKNTINKLISVGLALTSIVIFLILFFY